MPVAGGLDSSFCRRCAYLALNLVPFLLLPLLRRGLNWFVGCALFKSASIIPVLPPVSSGKRSGKLSGRAYFTPPSKEKRKAEPLVFQRDSAICENFSKKSVLSRKISRKLRFSERRSEFIRILSNVSSFDEVKAPFELLFIVDANAYPAGQTGHIPNVHLHPHHSRHRLYAQDQPSAILRTPE